MTRSYHPYTEKHKRPKGFGSRCPAKMGDDPARLLARAISVPDVSEKKLWIASGRWCFCAHRSPHAGPDAWHGFPVIGADVDERVWAALLDAGLATPREVNRLRAQRQLPEAWP